MLGQRPWESTIMLQQMDGALVVPQQHMMPAGHHPLVPIGLGDVHGPGGGGLGAAASFAWEAAGWAQLLVVQPLGVCREGEGG